MNSRFFLPRSGFSLFSRSFFYALPRSFLLRPRERENAKKARAPPSVFYDDGASFFSPSKIIVIFFV
jgi:hypothetical protein